MSELVTRFLERDDAGDHEGALALLRDAFEAFSRGDRDVLLGALDENVDWVLPEIFPSTTIEPGIPGVVKFIDEQFEPFEDFRIVPEDYVRNGDRAAILVRQRGRGRASGVEVEIRVAQLWTIRGARVVRFEGVANHDEARRLIAAE